MSVDVLVVSERRFDRACACPDPLSGRYEPCESCGTRVALHGSGWAEDDVARGCPIDENDEPLNHALNWTLHTPDRCREIRREASR